MMDSVGESFNPWNSITSYINNFDPGAALNTVKENLNPPYYRIFRSFLGGEVSIKEDGEGVQWFGETFRCRINTQETKISGEHFWFVLAFSITTIAGSCLLYGWWSNRSAKNLLLKKVTELETTSNKRKSKLAELRAEIKAKEQEIKVLTQSVHEKELTITKLRSDDISSLERDAEVLEEKNKKLIEKQQKTSEKKKEYKTNASEKATLISDKENEIRQLREVTIAGLEKELAVLKETKDQLTEENKRLSDENLTIREDLRKTSSSTAELATSLAGMQKKLSEAEKNLKKQEQYWKQYVGQVLVSRYLVAKEEENPINEEDIEVENTEYFENIEHESDGEATAQTPNLSPILSPRENTNTEEGKEKEKGAEV